MNTFDQDVEAATLYQAIDVQRAQLSEMVVARQYERQPELWKP